jgi:thiol-disulfide isomerase/thioredoxin
MSADSIIDGSFYSGKHWSEPWDARKDENAGLHDPDSLTYIVPGSGAFGFSAKNMQGDPVLFGADQFKEKLTVVQLFGSWCPNCADESRWLSEVYNKYNSQGLQVIPVAFERGDDFEAQKQGVQRLWKSLEMPYQPFIGGRANKGEASQVFPMLNKVMSYPTAIIIDKKGEVRKIHTGFYGPGTGKYYHHHTERLELFLRQLLEE